MMRGFTDVIARWAGSFGAVAADTVLAAGCPVCETPLHRARGGVCGSCWTELDSGRWGAASLAEAPIRGIDSLATLGPYEGRLRRLIRSLKFSGLAGAGGPLGGLLGSRIAGGAGQIDLVVAVPLHWRRRWSRGYNQAECIARGLAERIDRPIQRAGLRRVRPTRSQTGKDRKERLVNVRGAFSADPRLFAGRRLLLVDDVVTTGATLRACARALREAGALRVQAAAAARATAPGSGNARPSEDRRIET